MKYKGKPFTIGEIRDNTVDVIFENHDTVEVGWSGLDTQGDAARRALWLIEPNPFITVALIVSCVFVLVAVVL